MRTEKTLLSTHDFIKEVVVKYVGKRRKTPTIQQGVDVLNTINSLIVDDQKEHFIALYLNAAHQVETYSVVSVGTLNSSMVHPREVFKPALMVGAAAVIVAHPSGSLEASPEDIRVTDNLAARYDSHRHVPRSRKKSSR